MFVLGIDFGTESVRIIIADAANGQIIGTDSCGYPRFAEGLFCDPPTKKFRQHPLDYLEAFENSFGRHIEQMQEETEQGSRVNTHPFK